MTVVYIVLMCLAALFAGLWLYSLWAAFQNQKLRSYEEWTDRFYSLSSKLLEYEDIPQEWVEIFETINSTLMERGVAYSLARSYSKEFQDAKVSASSGSSSLSQNELDFMTRHPDAGRDFVAALRSAFLAATFLAPLNFGAQIRANMAEAWQRNRANVSAVKEVEAVGKATSLKLVPKAA